MKQVFNVIIEHNYLVEEAPMFSTVESRGDAERVLRDDLAAFKGDPSRWRGFIEEVYVADAERVNEERLRVNWLGGVLEQQARDQKERDVASVAQTTEETT